MSDDWDDEQNGHRVENDRGWPMTEAEYEAVRAIEPSPRVPRRLESEIMDRLRRSELIDGDARFRGWAWVRPAALAAALVATFFVGYQMGRGRVVTAEVPAFAPAAEERPSSPSLRFTQFHQAGSDPFEHFSAVEENPRDQAVLIKTWEY